MQSFLQSVIKWLSITIVVLVVLSTLMLGLGYLLKENEKEVTALKAESEGQSQSSPDKPGVVSIDAYKHKLEIEGKMKQKLARDVAVLRGSAQAEIVIVEHLTCQDVSQCRLFDTRSLSLGCVVAVNVIGFSKLDKLTLPNKDEGCEEQIEQLSLACHHNICSIN